MGGKKQTLGVFFRMKLLAGTLPAYWPAVGGILCTIYRVLANKELLARTLPANSHFLFLRLPLP